jgi:hypothetical protein
MNIRHVLIAGAAVAATAAIVPAAVNAGDGEGPTSTYLITVENLTPAGSQPMSPVGTVVHGNRTDVWSTGHPASAAVAAVAEDANLPVFVSTYSQIPGVSSALVGGGAPFGPGGSVSFEIEAKPGERLSLVSMLVNSNDAFTGLDAVHLSQPFQVFEVGAYDAGTEINNEDPAFIPGPAGSGPGVRAPEGAVITPHGGIIGQTGGIDPAVYDWNDPVARITVERLD